MKLDLLCAVAFLFVFCQFNLSVLLFSSLINAVQKVSKSELYYYNLPPHLGHLLYSVTQPTETIFIQQLPLSLIHFNFS